MALNIWLMVHPFNRELKQPAFLTRRTSSPCIGLDRGRSRWREKRNVKLSCFANTDAGFSLIGFTSFKMGCSFRFGREIALLSHANGYIADDELMLLLDENMSSNPEFSYEICGRFDLNEIPEAECKSDFRFEKKDIPLLANVLGIPETFKCPQRSVVPGIEGLCALLKRMAYPCRYSDMISIFGRPVPVLSMVTNQVLDYIYETHGHRITQWNHNILNPVLLQRYTESIWQKGAALENCLGFVDGTVRPICRPNKHQRIVYNGHKRVHSLKFQSIAIPNGLIANMYGPVGKYVYLYQ